MLKTYAAIVLILQIGFKLINDEKFLKQYGWDKALNSYLQAWNIIEYMPILGFSKPSDKDVNIVKLFLSPIIFYITTSILKDHFNKKISNEKKLKASQDQISDKEEDKKGLKEALLDKSKKEDGK